MSDTVPNAKNYYGLLGVPRDASVQVIRDTYKELARIYHPDSHFFDDILAEAGLTNAAQELSQTNAEAEETFKLITDAYTSLNNPQKRLEYDASLPRETPEWDVDLKSEFKLDQKKRQFENPDAAQPYSWGNFGAVEEPQTASLVTAPLFGYGISNNRTGGRAGSSRNSAQLTPNSLGKERPYDSDDGSHYVSVSQIIKQQNSFSARLRRFFGR